MNRDRLSLLAHAGLDLMNPLPAAAIERLLDAAGLSPGDRAADIGAGKAGVALLLLGRGARVTLVERSPVFCAAAREAVERAGLAAGAVFAEEDARAFVERTARDPYRLVVCTGASHALGGRDAALSALAGITAPGGHVLFGDGYWRKRPSPAYLEALGAAEDEMGSLDDIVYAASGCGLVPVDVEAASVEAFDAYELGWCAGLDRFADEQPDDPDAPTARAVAASRRDAYHRWGRDELGFAVYLLKNTA